MKIPNQGLTFAGEQNLTVYKMFVDYWNHYRSLNGAKNVEFQQNTITPEGAVVPPVKLEKKLKKELQPGTRVVSNRFTFPTLDRVQEDGDAMLYLFNPDGEV